MATTTNYGWTTPDDTALVKDGAAAIRTLGSSIDTTTKALNPSTTLGDIEYRSSTANTNTRLAIGTTGQVLTVAGGVPSWATSSSGGMTLLSTTTLSGASTTISGISGSYNDLLVIVSGVSNATSDGYFYCDPNSSETISSFLIQSTSGSWTRNADFRIQFNMNTLPLRTNTNNSYALLINQYASSTAYKPSQVYGYYVNTSSTSQPNAAFGGISTTSAITSLKFSNSGGNLSTGTVLIYGVK